MARFEDGCYGSIKGIALIAKVLAGKCKLHYTRVAAGKGIMSEDETPKTITEPPDYVMDAMISSVTNPVDGECQVSVQINSMNVETGFYVTGLLLYAEDPDEGEIPFTYLSLENEPEWIRPASSIVGKLANFDIITAVIDPEAIATVGKVEQMLVEHNTDPNAHGGIGNIKISDIVISIADWEKESGELYTAVVSVPEANEELYPLVSLHKKSLDIAYKSGLYPVVQTQDGILRFWARTQPTEDMKATLVLLQSHSGSLSNISGDRVIPVASSTVVGGVRVCEGSGLTVDPNGNLSIDAMTEKDVKDIFNTSNTD